MNKEDLSSDNIRRYLTSKSISDIVIYDVLDSTNDKLKEMATNGACEGCLVIAKAQTRGRGRGKHTFFSPKGTGIYMSLLLRPEINIADTPLLTTAAAVSVAKAIETISGKKTSIKWVNDIFIDEHKVCGILTEACMKDNNTKLDFAIIGIGVNVSSPEHGFPKDISTTASSIYSTDEKLGNIKNKLIAEILNNIMSYYNNIEERNFYKEYKERLHLIGQDITVHKGDSAINAVATGIDRDFHLLVTYPDGTSEALTCGEISIRPRINTLN